VLNCSCHWINETFDPNFVAALLEGRRAILNAIPWNAVEGSDFARPPLERAVAFVRGLRARGTMATLRWSAAQEVDGGCGQLRARRALRGTPAEDGPAQPETRVVFLPPLRPGAGA
jgi:adenine C2-methylase RlmN of 23S rRNA A2503 and tRNA A37